MLCIIPFLLHSQITSYCYRKCSVNPSHSFAPNLIVLFHCNSCEVTSVECNETVKGVMKNCSASRKCWYLKSARILRNVSKTLLHTNLADVGLHFRWFGCPSLASTLPGKSFPSDFSSGLCESLNLIINSDVQIGIVSFRYASCHIVFQYGLTDRTFSVIVCVWHMPTGLVHMHVVSEDHCVHVNFRNKTFVGMTANVKSGLYIIRDLSEMDDVGGSMKTTLKAFQIGCSMSRVCLREVHTGTSHIHVVAPPGSG